MECFKSNKSKHYKRKRKQRKTSKDIEDKQIMIKGKREIMSKTEYKKGKTEREEKNRNKKKDETNKKKRGMTKKQKSRESGAFKLRILIPRKEMGGSNQGGNRGDRPPDVPVSSKAEKTS